MRCCENSKCVSKNGNLVQCEYQFNVKYGNYEELENIKLTIKIANLGIIEP